MVMEQSAGVPHLRLINIGVCNLILEINKTRCAHTGTTRQDDVRNRSWQGWSSPHFSRSTRRRCSDVQSELNRLLRSCMMSPRWPKGVFLCHISAFNQGPKDRPEPTLVDECHVSHCDNPDRWGNSCGWRRKLLTPGIKCRILSEKFRLPMIQSKQRGKEMHSLHEGHYIFPELAMSHSPRQCQYLLRTPA
jgi:hypothetical protein